MALEMYTTIFMFLLAMSLTNAENGNSTVNKTQCINDLVQWCKNPISSEDNSSVLSTTDFFSNDTIQIVCYKDDNITNCTKNDNLWFFCSSNGTIDYNGEPLNKSTVDDQICDTRDILIHNLFNETVFEYELIDDLWPFGFY